MAESREYVVTVMAATEAGCVVPVPHPGEATRAAGSAEASCRKLPAMVSVRLGSRTTAGGPSAVTDTAHMRPDFRGC